MRYKKSNKKKILGLTVAALLVLGGVAAALEISGVTDFYQRKPAAQNAPLEGINYDPPTEEEQQAGNEHKQEVEDQDDQPAPGGQNATIVIVDANQYGAEIEVRAFISNLIKDGICTITFKKDTYSIQKQVSATADASTTPCMNLEVPRSEFAVNGSWTVTVEYSAVNAYGKTEQVIEIE